MVSEPNPGKKTAEIEVAHSNKSAEGNNQFDSVLLSQSDSILKLRISFRQKNKKIEENDAVVVEREDMRGYAVTGYNELRRKE